MLNKLLLILCIIPSVLYAQSSTIDGYDYTSAEMLEFDGIVGSPSVSSVGKSKIYFDETLGKLQCSENGGAYTDCVGAGGGGGSGTVNTGATGYFTYYPANGTTVDDQTALYTNGTNVGIGTSNPTVKLQIGNPVSTSNTSNLTIKSTTTGAGIGVSESGGNILYAGISSSNGLIGTEGGSNLPLIFKAGSNAGQIVYNSGNPRWTLGNTGTAGSTVSISRNMSVGSTYYTLAAPSNGVIIEGNTGIGVSSPTQKLDVAGTVRATAIQATGISGSTQCVQADTNGNLTGTGSVCGGAGSTPGGSDTQVQYNSAGSFAGSANFTFDGTNVDTNGTMTANKFILDGFGTDPQIYPSVDTNSGLFFSGPDVLEIHTGGLNGLAINSSQNVGVATHSPTSKLHVYNTSAGNSFEVDDQASDTTPFVIDSSGRVGINSASPQQLLSIFTPATGIADMINLYQNAGNANDESRINFSTSAGRLDGAIGVQRAGAGVKGLLKLYSGSAGVLTARLAIDPDNGNVGISTTKPAALLDVLNTAAIDSFRVNDQASDTTPFIINSEGNVGIGISSPASKFHSVTDSVQNEFVVETTTSGNASSSLRGYSSGTATITQSQSGAVVELRDKSGTNLGFSTISFQDNGGSNLAMISGVMDDTTANSGSLDLITSSAGSRGVRLKVDSSGNVGIGTIAPVAELEVTQIAALDAFRVNDQATDTTPFIITSAGNVGIGTSLPSRPLSVYASTPVVQITNSTAGGTANDGLLLTQSALDSIIENSEAGSLYLRTTATNRVKIDAGGNVGIGSLTPAAALDVTGKIRASTGTAGQAVCWKADKTLGQCTTVVGVTGDCTCS